MSRIDNPVSQTLFISQNILHPLYHDDRQFMIIYQLPSKLPALSRQGYHNSNLKKVYILSISRLYSIFSFAERLKGLNRDQGTTVDLLNHQVITTLINMIQKTACTKEHEWNTQTYPLRRNLQICKYPVDSGYLTYRYKYRNGELNFASRECEQRLKGRKVQRLRCCEM